MLPGAVSRHFLHVIVDSVHQLRAVTATAGLRAEDEVPRPPATAATNMGEAGRMAADAEDKAAFKGIAAVASIFAAPVTGGASLAATAGLDGLSAIHKGVERV